MATASPISFPDEDDDHVPYVICEELIDASPETVFGILTNYDRTPKIFHNIKRLRVLREEGCLKLMEHLLQPLPPMPRISYVVLVKETYPTMLRWRGRTSYIKVNQGWFALRSMQQGKQTAVQFAAWAEAAALVPAIVIRRQMETIMPQVLQTLKTHAEKAVISDR